MISVQTQDFDARTLYEALRTNAQTGAIVTFTGLVREFSDSQPLHLEHYPKMTESVLNSISNDAKARWPLESVTVVHRVGELAPTEQIVFVGVASAHRKAAFEASHYIIDLLKTQAPFWKKEGSEWVKAKESDDNAAKRWGGPGSS